MKTVTIDEVLDWSPCPKYDKAALLMLAGRKKKMSGVQILALKIPVEDRFWAILRHGFLDDKDLRLFSCDCAEHVLGIFEEKYPTDKRPRECIATARRFVNGKATAEEMAAGAAGAAEAAWAAGAARAAGAAWAARAAGAAWAAWAAGAAWAAWAARAAGAAWAAWAAEQAWQVKRLKKYLEAKA